MSYVSVLIPFFFITGLLLFFVYLYRSNKKGTEQQVVEMSSGNVPEKDFSEGIVTVECPVCTAINDVSYEYCRNCTYEIPLQKRVYTRIPDETHTRPKN